MGLCVQRLPATTKMSSGKEAGMRFLTRGWKQTNTTNMSSADEKECDFNKRMEADFQRMLLSTIILYVGILASMQAGIVWTVPITAAIGSNAITTICFFVIYVLASEKLGYSLVSAEHMIFYMMVSVPCGLGFYVIAALKEILSSVGLH